MKPSAYYNRVVDVMEKLVSLTVLLRPHAEQLVDRFPERKEAGAGFVPATGPSSIATALQTGKSWHRLKCVLRPVAFACC